MIHTSFQSDERWCKDHVEQVYGYLRFLEHSKEVRPNFLAHHGHHASPKMRQILTDWMVQVGRRFRLLNDTLFLSVAYMDRYLQRVETVEKSQMQLVGVACMMLASKNEEIYSPAVSDFVYVCDKAYTEGAKIRQILKIISYFRRDKRHGAGSSWSSGLRTIFRILA